MILDTNALSAWADGQPGVFAPLARARRLVLPAVTLGEYLFGILQSRRRQRYEKWLVENLLTVEIADIGRRTAREYALVRMELKAHGTPIPVNDSWIAALAREHGLPILSQDRHFDQISGIHRVGWES